MPFFSKRASARAVAGDTRWTCPISIQSAPLLAQSLLLLAPTFHQSQSSSTSPISSHVVHTSTSPNPVTLSNCPNSTVITANTILEPLQLRGTLKVFSKLARSPIKKNQEHKTLKKKSKTRLGLMPKNNSIDWVL